MPNFRLVFATEIIEKSAGNKIVREGRGFGRVISAPDKQIAEKIANAMLGEEVFPLPLYLGQVLSVEETDLPPRLNGFLCDSDIWDRVLFRLRLVLDQVISGQETFDGFDYYLPFPSDSGKTIKVGLIFTKAQQDRLLSIPPSISL
jgi:hypothetical protein